MPHPRLFVLTDISSLTPGVREPDDGQSMCRLMLYACDIELEGLVATSNLGHGQVCRPELIHDVIDACARVHPNLLTHRSDYPTPEALHAVVGAGQPVAGPKVPVTDSVGEGKETDASRRLIAAADRADGRPLWVAVWGGTADLAQALWTVRATRSASDLSQFVARLRVHAISDQDSTAQWIKEEFPDLFYITRKLGIRGMYRFGDTSLTSSDWLAEHVRNHHGPLGALYPDYQGGDIWSGTMGRVHGVKEGDTPSYLTLIPNGLSNVFRAGWSPTWIGWGGAQIGEGKRWTDATPEEMGSIEACVDRVARWRWAYQNDFAARLDWCVRDVSSANHAPIARIASGLDHTLAAGESLTLDASASTDPDHDALHFNWSIDDVASMGRVILQTDGSRCRVTGEAPGETHLLLTVTDDGAPPLTSYARVIVRVR